MQKIYQKDIKILKDKLNANTDAESFITLQKCITENMKEETKLIMEKKMIQNKVSAIEKKMKMAKQIKVFRSEEEMIKLIEIEREKSSELEKRLTQAHEVFMAKKKAIEKNKEAMNDVNERIKKLKDGSIINLSLIHICRCRRLLTCRSRWSPYH
eukprot:TRINITY_DN12921_c0_g1_i12.p2 TRINITY_DN12921_c0_g1~~TRINITY_DN12921_c0_g1_i12.p2  ORF type:complete len:155 (-),score=47.39 TRINITY_DN12921_c0_g1_i12:16-480(-)